MTTIEQLLKLLVLALREPLRRREAIGKFQVIVWEGLDPALPAMVRDILRELAYDLDFFEARQNVRNERRSVWA